MVCINNVAFVNILINKNFLQSHLVFFLLIDCFLAFRLIWDFVLPETKWIKTISLKKLIFLASILNPFRI